MDDPLFILKNCPTLNKDNCLVVDGFLVERLYDHPDDMKYRQFITVNHYEYITDTDFIYYLDDFFRHLELDNQLLLDYEPTEEEIEHAEVLLQERKWN